MDPPNNLNDNYYSYNGEHYTKTFPVIWAKTHIDGTGPKNCKSCKQYGSWNGVFVAYCVSCALKYNFTRGYGIRYGIHNGEDNIFPCSDNYGTSVTNTYMKDICIDEVGDKERFVDSSQKYRFQSHNITMNKIAERNKLEYLVKLQKELDAAWELQVTWSRVRQQIEY
uniref:Uncharacterized protein n=1 Tax=viral metagenome TaxID=1070528 RepID=A0A6C0DU37_9ZZZZ